MERGWKPRMDQISPNCPRCGSSNTKFCYYNNYSLTQPRYFCKGCRRYWTKGGSLRNVPFGGGCRKNRRCKSLRLPVTDGKSFSCDSIRHSYGPTVESNNSSSSSVSDGSRIDLALVYANFLSNQQSENKSGFEFDPSLEFSRLSNSNNMESSIQIPQVNGLIENYELPPLPGDDLSSQEILWSNSNSRPAVSLTLQATREPALEPETRDPNQIFGNWNPFDLYT